MVNASEEILHFVRCSFGLFGYECNKYIRFFLVAYVGFSKILSTNDATDFCEFHSLFVIYLKLPSIPTELTR